MERKPKGVTGKLKESIPTVRGHPNKIIIETLPLNLAIRSPVTLARASSARW